MCYIAHMDTLEQRGTGARRGGADTTNGRDDAFLGLDDLRNDAPIDPEGTNPGTPIAKRRVQTMPVVVYRRRRT